MRSTYCFFLAGLLVLLSGSTGWSVSNNSFNPDISGTPVEFSVSIEPSTVRPQEEVRVVVSMKIKNGWHIYSLIPGEDASIPPTTTSWSSTWLNNRGPAYETNPIVKFDPVIGGVIGYHENRARFYQNFKVADSPIAGTQTLTGSIKYQACDARICLLPTTKNFEIPFQIEKLPPRADYAFMNRAIDSLPPSGDLLPSDASLDSALSGGILVFMLLAAVMGMTSWLTPCVFPMIPITVSYFSKRSRDKSQNLVWLAMVFCLGIVLTYTGIGILASALIGATAISNLASNPWINLGIAALFFAFALSLMGFFEFRLPFGLVNRVEHFSRKSNGYAGVILMGTAFTLTAFTCTVQFVGTLLIAAAHGEWVWPVIGMLIFSSVFALPFLVLALFPVWIQSLQRKSGNWMMRLKFSIGLLELIAVTKFLSNADLVWELGMLNRSTILIVWSAIVLIVAVVILGILPIPGLKGSQFRTPRTIPAALLLTLSLYFGYGSLGKPLDGWTESYLPPEVAAETVISRSYQGAVLSDSEAHLNWQSNLDEAFVLSSKENKPLFVDFTGYTCVNCRWMEKNTFKNPDVHDRLTNRFIRVRLYTDGGKGHLENQRLQVERFKTIALPFYVILSPDNRVLGRTSGISHPPEFIRFLDASFKKGESLSPETIAK